jgi:predicted DNA-binding transcriptional regulator AlpA
MEINQSLENALKLADLDMNRIQYEIDEEFKGSMDAYFNHVRQLSTDFETALALLVLSSKPDQISTFASLNLIKIDISIRHIRLFDELCSKNQIMIDSDSINTEIINGFFHPIDIAHLSVLVYIEKLLKDVLKNINGKPTATVNQPELANEVDHLEKELVPDKIEFLIDYPEILTMKHMEEIFHCKRNAIYTKEKEGHFKRCTSKNSNVGFRKEKIIQYLSTRN